MIAPTRLHQTGNGSVSTGNGIEFFPVNHANTFQGRASTMASTYREYDVALRNSIENARLMRNDSSIMECLEARQRAVALLKWHIEPEDDRSLEQKQLAEEMTKVREEIKLQLLSQVGPSVPKDDVKELHPIEFLVRLMVGRLRQLGNLCQLFVECRVRCQIALQGRFPACLQSGC